MDTLRERLVIEASDGRRQRLFGMLSAGLRDPLEQLAVTAPPACQVSAFLGLLGVVVRATGHAPLAKALAEPLAHTLNPPDDLARYLRPEVAWTVAETHRYRAEIAVVQGLPNPGEPPVGPHLRAAFGALSGLPADLLEAALLSSYARSRAAAELVVLVPPTTGLTRAAAAGEPRPPTGPWPPELAAAVPPEAAVVDARAERLWLDEAVAEVATRQPKVVAILQPNVPGPEFGALLDLLRAAVPQAALWLLVEGEPAPRPGVFQRVLTGPSFDGLARPRDAATSVDQHVPVAPLADIAAWPLACYRQTATDADVVLPVAGRSGAAIARALAAAHQQCPVARLRLAPGLSSAQAAELVVAVRRPDPPAWSMPIMGASLPAEPRGLRRAGLSSVVVTVGSERLPPPLLAVVAEALQAAGITLQVKVLTDGLERDATLGELRAAEPEAVSFHGAGADAFDNAWRQATSQG